MEAVTTEPVNLDAVIADMRARAEGWNSERYTMLSPETVGALVAEFDRLRNQEECLNLARQVLIENGYFRADEVGDDLAPRLIEWLSHKRSAYRAPVEVDVRVDEHALWRAILPRLEAWADERTRRQIQMAGMRAAELRAGAYRGWSHDG